MLNKKKSFFERLTGGVNLEEDEVEIPTTQERSGISNITRPGMQQAPTPQQQWVTEEEPEEAELTVDVYQTPTEIVVQSMTAGVRPEDLEVNITRDMITIKGKREENKTVTKDDYFIQELYWGTFSRTILLPQEVEPELAEAVEKHGLLIIRIPKIDKSKQANLKVKSI